MERKIGEIFEYNGEWFQCVKNDEVSCEDCDFTEYCESYSGSCDSTSRNDGKSICFKKLEKRGGYFYYGCKKYQYYNTYSKHSTSQDKRVHLQEDTGVILI